MNVLTLRILRGSTRLIRSFSRISIDPKTQATQSIAHFCPESCASKYALSLVARNPSLEIGHQNRRPLNEIMDLPLIINKIIDNPREVHEINEISQKFPVIEMPNNAVIDENGIQAARLIVIRRRMMKKHKLKKLRKKMKFEWAKVRQRREMRKEKAFQAKLIAQIKDAEKFSAESYVAEKLRQANETPIPRFWKGKRLPQFIIKQKLGLK